MADPRYSAIQSEAQALLNVLEKDGRAVAASSSTP
jgi:hypothetical protein